MLMDSYMPTRIISGRGCVKGSGKVFRELGSRCLIVTGGSSASLSGALEDVKLALTDAGIEYKVFDGITQNPLTADCRRAGDAADFFGADFIVGVGGGSPLDAAKAVAIYASNPKMSASDIYNREYDNSPLPLALVGTTAGTGSEVTGVSVLTHSETGRKKSISGADCYAAVSFCDSSYTHSMPYGVTVSTALDAFAHASESFFSKQANSLSSLYAQKAMELVWQGLKELHTSGSLPDSELRERLYIGSLYAGLAINITGTCFPHTVGYILTEDYHIPHGRACAAFTVDFVNIACEADSEKGSEFYKILGSSDMEFAKIISDLAHIDITMTQAEIDKYSLRWQGEIKNFSRTPGDFNGNTAAKILLKYVKN